MKKIMFNDRYGLTKAVLDGRKTMTRRVIPDIWIDFPRSGRQKAVIAGLNSQVLMMDLSHVLGENCLYSAERKYQPKYYKGDEVSVAQAYKDVYPNADFEMVDKEFMTESAGWNNKMFVKAEYMPHSIRITDIKLELLQDISYEDCLREGVERWLDDYIVCGLMERSGRNNRVFGTPRAAFASLIDRISGKGTWERNPWVYAYEFELIK